MADFYEKTIVGTSPVSLSGMKVYLKSPPATDDALVQSLIDACTDYGESYTGREFRANTWKLLTDCFITRQELRRNPINTITSIKHIVGGSLVTVTSTDYYKKDAALSSEILLVDGKDWPTNTAVVEHGVEYIFVTKAYPKPDIIPVLIKRHVAFMYENRGDCCECDEAAALSGVNISYNTFRIPRIF